jgi:hypothetical protein
MSYTIIDVEQRSEAWIRARLGRLTGSRANDMLATHKDGKTPSTSRRNLRVQLVLERITGESQEDEFTNGDMQRGRVLEEDAIAAYEAKTDELVAPTGFLSHTELMAGCSLDGHIGGMVGLVDVKCPRAGVHLEYLRADTIPLDYKRQLTHNLWMTGAEWAEMVSYCPQFPEKFQLCIRRLTREQADIKAYDAEVRKFLAECDTEYNALQTMSDRFWTAALAPEA